MTHNNGASVQATYQPPVDLVDIPKIINNNCSQPTAHLPPILSPSNANSSSSSFPPRVMLPPLEPRLPTNYTYDRIQGRNLTAYKNVDTLFSQSDTYAIVAEMQARFGKGVRLPSKSMPDLACEAIKDTQRVCEGINRFLQHINNFDFGYRILPKETLGFDSDAYCLSEDQKYHLTQFLTDELDQSLQYIHFFSDYMKHWSSNWIMLKEQLTLLARAEEEAEATETEKSSSDSSESTQVCDSTNTDSPLDTSPVMSSPKKRVRDPSLRKKTNKAQEAPKGDTYYSSPTYSPPTKKQKKAATQKKKKRVTAKGTCAHCSATETPEWRKGPAAIGSICNACGLFYKKLKMKYGLEAAEQVMVHRKERGETLNRVIPSTLGELS